MEVNQFNTINDQKLALHIKSLVTVVTYFDHDDPGPQSQCQAGISPSHVCWTGIFPAMSDRQEFSQSCVYDGNFIFQSPIRQIHFQDP